MKCIEDEIPFEVPEGWAWCRLKHVCTMAAGKAKPTDQIMTEPFEGCYPCFGGNGIRGYVDEYNQDGIFSIVGRQGALCGNINIAKLEYICVVLLVSSRRLLIKLSHGKSVAAFTKRRRLFTMIVYLKYHLF